MYIRTYDMITTNHYTLSGGMTDEVQPKIEWAKPCLFQADVSGGGHLGSSWVILGIPSGGQKGGTPNTLEVKFMDNPMKTRMMTGDTPISGTLQMAYILEYMKINSKIYSYIVTSILMNRKNLSHR